MAYGAEFAVYAAIAAAIIGTGVTMYSQYQQAQAQGAVLRHNQRLAMVQAEYARMQSEHQARQLEQQIAMLGASAGFESTVAQQNAEQALIAAEYEKQLILQEGTAARGAARVAEEDARHRLDRVQAAGRSLIAASGVETEGSPLMVLMENAAQTENDVERIRYGAALRERAAELDSSATDYEGKLRARGYGIEGARARNAAASETASLRSEAAQIRFGGGLRAWGFRQEGELIGLQRRAVSGALPYQIGSTFLTGVASAASSYRSPYRSSSGTMPLSFAPYG